MKSSPLTTAFIIIISSNALLLKYQTWKPAAFINANNCP